MAASVNHQKNGKLLKESGKEFRHSDIDWIEAYQSFFVPYEIIYWQEFSVSLIFPRSILN